jgi:hypothetical protein
MCLCKGGVGPFFWIPSNEKLFVKLFSEMNPDHILGGPCAALWAAVSGATESYSQGNTSRVVE